MVSDEEFKQAMGRGRARKAACPGAASARYDASTDKVIIGLTNGVEISFAPAMAEGLEGASPAALSRIEISPSGFGLHFPALDADLYIPGLLEGALGSRRWMAARMGATGGSARTAAKSRAARENGKLGGRPRKVAGR
jgi:hypothetical protein